ncbi:phage tail protein [Paraclostridium bifermentans]|uniref:phage tail protein n=3 Tax=Paraclostridium TaxID=1849822 RepID=UPI001CC40DF5|nr:phage tail protein [Paraclostridium bifermentans]MBZ6007597.1 phage tail protein [Paraclostridium bifermentans]
MLNLHNKDKVKVAGLVDYKNLYIEKELASGDKTLVFSYPKTSKFYFDIEEECYIRTKEDEFIVKEKNVHSDYTDFKCLLNLEDLEGKPFERYASEEQTIDKALALALAGTGWIVGECYLKKKRTVRKSNCSSLEIIKEIRKTYRCDLVFNTLTKTIDVYESLGEDKGTYFIDSLNLKDLSIQGNTYDYFTRIIPIGKDDLRISEINNGKDYVENYQYSNKVKTYYWKDDRYTVIENLKEDAEAKLGAMSKPYRSYSADILNLAKLNNKYKDILDFKLGDTITLISKDNKFRDKQRIVKIIEHPDEHELDSVEISNTTLSFEETQTQFQEAADTINNITTDNGTIDGSTVDGIDTNQITDFEDKVIKVTNIDAVSGKIHNLEATNVTITGELSSVKATIGILETNVATIDKLTVSNSASINELQATKASINQLEVVNASIKVLEANVGKIDTLLNGNLSSENIQAGGITSDKLSISNGFIKNAMIDSLDVSKVNAGDISTNKFRIKSDDGGVEIVGATQQFKDKNNKVRIQMGKDAKGDFNFIIRGEDGTTTLIDHNGIKQKAIADDLIISNMIASDSVGEKQINYSSFTNGFNKDTNTSTLKATKIKLDNQNQSLEVAFNSLKTQADGTKTVTENNSTTITVMQGKITTAINNTQIVKDGQTILLKDDYNRTVATVNSMNSTIGSHTTQLNEATGKIENVETKVNTVERDLNSITARVSSTETNISTVNILANNANNKALSAEQLAKSMADSKMIFIDPNFRQGYNNVSLYNNANNGNVTITRITKIPDCPTTSTHCLEIKHIGAGSPGFGGFYQNIASRSNAVFIQKFIAKLPTGYTLNTASNSMGTGYTDKWLTPNQGTDKWETYIREVRCGATGTFSNGGHVYVSGSTTPTTSSPLVWYLAYCTCFDLTDNDETVNSLKTEISTTTSKVSSIEASLTSITSRVSNVESKQTTTDGKVVSLETWKKEAEQKITDASIVSIVSKQFYSKGETDSKYTTQSQLTQLVDSFEFKFTNNTNDNLLKNSAFLNDLKSWGKNSGGNITIYSDSNFKEGNSIKLDLTQENQGLFQTDIDCSNGLAIRIYANASRPIDIRFGIEGVLTQIVRIGDGSWKELKLIIPPTSNTGAFIFYTKAGGSHTIYANRFKVQTGNSCTPWSSHQSEVYSTVTKIDTDGIHMDCVEANNRVDIDTGGMYITDKSTNQRLLNATGYGITVRGGRFYVDDPKNGYTLLWGRDIVINGGRAVVGTNFNPESPLAPNKMYLNYNNDFKNGVEIGGKLTNNGKDILAVINMMKQESGYLHLTNGMILQWGRLSSTIANGDTVQATVGFPIGFPTKCCSVSATITGVDGQGDLAARYNGALKVVNNSYGVFFARNVTPEKWGSTMEISYIAIGY